jgi:hypothetical protein
MSDPQPEPTPDPQPAPDEPAPDVPSSHDTSGQFPADEVEATHTDS